VTTALESSADQPGSPVNAEAGTAPGDRRFRPDIQGLRAVAVLLVVLYHAGFSGLSGGYVGVDVFFVISGFVITGLLLRERATSGRTSLFGFYGRRSRRIIPAATLVIVATVLLAYARLGIVIGNTTAGDARWTAFFLANFHFASIGTNYLTAQRPPSPLLNFWSLAVEEQFYLVYPTIFFLIAALRTRWSLHARLAIGLVVIIAVSFAVGDPDCLRSHRRLLLTSHPRLGAGHRCSRGRGHRLVAHAAQVTWSRPHLGGHGWHRLRCRRLQQPHPLPRILGGDPGGGHGAGHRGRRHRADRRGGMVAQAGPTPVGGQALVLDLPVALAPSGHCGRGRRQVRSPLPPKPRVAGPWP